MTHRERLRNHFLFANSNYYKFLKCRQVFSFYLVRTASNTLLSGHFSFVVREFCYCCGMLMYGAVTTFHIADSHSKHIDLFCCCCVFSFLFNFLSYFVAFLGDIEDTFITPDGLHQVLALVDWRQEYSPQAHRRRRKTC